MNIVKTQNFVALLLIVLILSACGSTDPTALPEENALESEFERTATPNATPTRLVVPDTPTSPPTATSTQVSEALPTATATSVPSPEPTATTPPAPASQIQLLPLASGFDRPTFLTHSGDDRLFVVEKRGRIRTIVDGAPSLDPFLDITDRVGSGSSEQGLLSMAFHPDFTENGRFFVNYTNLGGNTIVSSFQISEGDPNRAETGSETILLQVNQPFGNHNGGQLQFGPDGYLYIGLGDGGSQGDPEGNGQNSQTLLGSILRLDVDSDMPYAIPSDNPFVSDDGQADEIWAVGFRNPWRFSFDRETGDLYIADVGQSNWEEVNFQPAEAAGGANYGWNILEGSQCYRSESCDLNGLVSPVAEYSHAGGNCSITGGYVYRGEAYPELRGNYFFGDYCSGTIRSLFRGQNGDWLQAPVLESGLFISSFGEDVNGELYILDFGSGDIFKLASP